MSREIGPTTRVSASLAAAATFALSVMFGTSAVVVAYSSLDRKISEVESTARQAYAAAQTIAADSKAAVTAMKLDTDQRLIEIKTDVREIRAGMNVLLRSAKPQ